MKFRLLCFVIHLLMSFFIAVLLLGLVFGLWYPAPLDKALGVAHIFLLLLSIDVIVGPLLTLIVAKQGKKTLKKDLLVISFIQLLALVYGVYIVAQGRPIWMIYDSGRFEVVQAYEAVMPPNDLSSTNVFHRSVTGPIWGAVKNNLPATIVKGDAYYRAELLQIYDDDIAATVSANALPLSILKRFNNPNKVNKILRDYPLADSFVPVAAAQRPIVVLINKKTGERLALVDLFPW